MSGIGTAAAAAAAAGDERSSPDYSVSVSIGNPINIYMLILSWFVHTSVEITIAYDGHGKCADFSLLTFLC